MRFRLLLGAVVCAACGGDSAPNAPARSPRAFDVFTIGNIFSPASLPDKANEPVLVGDTIRFNFTRGADNMGHDVTFNAQAGAPPSISVTFGGTRSVVVTAAGTFHYICKVHEGDNMIGDITVK